MHLLLFGKPLTYDLIDRRLHKARRNRLLITPMFAVIGMSASLTTTYMSNSSSAFLKLLTALAGNATVVQNAVQVFELVSALLRLRT